MADSKITALTAITTVNPATYPLVIVDTSDTSMAGSGTTKKVTTNQLLGSGGTATLASATITGDLTVDTSTLKVDAANNRVGIGTASPTQVLTVRGNVLTTAAAGTDSYANVSTDGVQNSYLGFNNSGSTNAAGASNNNTYIGNGNNYGTQIVGNSNILASFGTTGVFNWYDGAGGTRMTLNSTGLGVGASPSYKLHVNGTDTTNVLFNGATKGVRFVASASKYSITGVDNTGAATFQPLAIGGASLEFQIGSTTQMTLDSAGNVGIGVTPSYKLDVSTGGVLNTTARLVGNDQSNVRLRFENTGASGRIWELVGGLAGSNNRWFSLRDVTGSTTPWGVDDSMNVISNVTGTAPTLSTNSQMVFNLTSNTNLRISVRGTDGTTRTANITLA